MPAKTELNLTTPDDISEGLRRIGVSWNPSPHSGESHDSLYSWVVGESQTGAVQRGVIYIGIDNSTTGGRVSDEHSWRGEGIHAHGLALARTKAIAVLSPVVLQDADRVDEAWSALSTRSERYPGEVERGRAWFDEAVAEGKLLSACEKFAIRLTVHLGDVGVPVNAQYKNAWNMKLDNSVRHADNVAFWVAKMMLKESY